MKVPPPYAKTLKPLDGWVWVACGKRAWHMAAKDQTRSTLAFPNDKDPYLYRWPVARRTAVVQGYGVGLPQAQRLVLALLDAGALGVYLIHADLAPQQFVYYPSDRASARAA